MVELDDAQWVQQRELCIMEIKIVRGSQKIRNDYEGERGAGIISWIICVLISTLRMLPLGSAS